MGLVEGRPVAVVDVITGTTVGRKKCEPVGVVGEGKDDGAGESVLGNKDVVIGFVVGSIEGNEVATGRMVEGTGVGERVGNAEGGLVLSPLPSTKTNSRRGANAPIGRTVLSHSRDRNATNPGLSSSLRRNPK